MVCRCCRRCLQGRGRGRDRGGVSTSRFGRDRRHRVCCVVTTYDVASNRYLRRVEMQTDRVWSVFARGESRLDHGHGLGRGLCVCLRDNPFPCLCLCVYYC